jgi:hypothetical protein
MYNPLQNVTRESAIVLHAFYPEHGYDSTHIVKSPLAPLYGLSDIIMQSGSGGTAMRTCTLTTTRKHYVLSSRPAGTWGGAGQIGPVPGPGEGPKEGGSGCVKGCNFWTFSLGRMVGPVDHGIMR